MKWRCVSLSIFVVPFNRGLCYMALSREWKGHIKWENLFFVVCCDQRTWPSRPSTGKCSLKAWKFLLAKNVSRRFRSVFAGCYLMCITSELGSTHSLCYRHFPFTADRDWTYNNTEEEFCVTHLRFFWSRYKNTMYSRTSSRLKATIKRIKKRFLATRMFPIDWVNFWGRHNLFQVHKQTWFVLIDSFSPCHSFKTVVCEVSDNHSWRMSVTSFLNFCVEARFSGKMRSHFTFVSFLSLFCFFT